MSDDAGAAIEEIIRNGGTFFLLEVRNPKRDEDFRLWLRNPDEQSFETELERERERRPDLEWRPKQVWVEIEVLDW